MKLGWQKKKLCEVYDVRDGTHDSPKYFATGYPLITSKNLKSEGISFDDVKFISEQDYKKINERSAVNKGDVLLAMIGTIGNPTIVTMEPSFAIKNVALFKVPACQSSAFLKYYLESEWVVSKMMEESRGTTQKFVGLGYLRNFPILLPPFPEQQRIVAILDEAFAGIATAKANTEKNLQNARAIFESHLNDVFTHHSKDWMEKRLDELCTFSSGGTPSKSNSSYWEGNIPWVSGRDMKSTQLSNSALHISQKAVDQSATRIAPVGSLLILVRGMGLAHGAQIAELLVPCAFNQDIRGIHVKQSLLPRYLLFALRNKINSSDTVLSNAAHGTLKIDSDKLLELLIPFPDVAEQKQIIAKIDVLTTETQRLEAIYKQKLDSLDKLKKSLLHRAFSGEL